MRIPLPTSTLVLIVPFVAACAANAPLPVNSAALSPAAAPARAASGADPLAGSAWALSQLGGQAPVPHATVSIAFAPGGGLSGSDGCNRYSSTYAFADKSLRLSGPIAQTKMACAKTISMQANRYIDALQRMAGYSLDDTNLRLLDAGGSALATFIAQWLSLPGSSWTVTGYNNGKQAVVSVLPGTELNASFGANGRLTGSAGCNTYVADFDAEGHALSIGVPRTTRKACAQPTGIMRQETAYTTALQQVTNYRIDGDRLELRTAAGALAATMARREEIEGGQ